MKISALMCFSLSLFAFELANAGQFTLSSESFADGSKIPLKYARNGINGGKNISPQITWENPPEGTKSFALICVDSAPVAGNWIHWMIINIPANTREIPIDASNKKMPTSCIELNNSYGFKGYGGPQPPEGTGVHPYIFSIYALNLDKVTTEKKFYNYDEFLKLINGRILGQTRIIGTFVNELR